MRAMVAEAMARRRGRRVVVGRAHAPRPRRPAGAVARRRAATRCWRWPRRPGEAGAGSIAYLPAERDRRPRRRPTRTTSSSSRTVSGLPVVIQGLGGRNKTDAPDRHVGGGAVVPRPRHRSRRARVLDAHRAAVRPPGRDRRDQLPLPRGAVRGTACCKLPHDERVARLRDPAARAELRDAVEHYNRDPGEGHHGAAAAVERGVRRRGREARAREVPVALDRARSPTSAASRRPTRCSTSRSPRTSPREFRWRTESPEWTAAVGEAQLDARMIDRHRPTAARTSRATTAPTGARTSCARGCSTARCGRSRRASARSPRCPAALRRLRRPRRARARARPPTSWCSTPRPSGRGRRSSCTTCPAASAASRRGARACRRPIVNGVPIVLDGELTGRLPGQVVRPGRTVDVSRRAAHRSDAVGVRRRRPRHRAAARVGRAAADEVPATYAPRVLQYDDHYRYACGDRVELPHPGPRRGDGRAGPDAARSTDDAGRGARAAPSRARGSTTWPSTASTRPRSTPRSG